MGVMRFLVQASSNLSDEDAQRAHLVGQDFIPWPCRATRTREGLTIERPVRDSGALRVPWFVPGQGQWMLATGTLVERETPYLLEVELARGKINQVRQMLADWQSAGLAPEPDTPRKLQSALAAFAQAVTRQTEPPVAAALAQQALVGAVEAGQQLAASYIAQGSPRGKSAQRPDPLLGASLGESKVDREISKPFRQSFNAALVPLSWPRIAAKEGAHDWTIADQQIGWCQAHRIKTLAGPLLQLDRGGIPDWLYLWAGDFDNLAAFAIEHVRAVVERFRGQVDLWQAVARAMAGSALSLSEEETLQLAVHVIEAVRQLDPNAPVVMSFDQPFAEYMAGRALDLSPWHFADALVRAGLGISAIMLELNFGYWPGGAMPRDLLDITRQLDLWSALGLPLLVNLTLPSASQADALARVATRIVPAPFAQGWTPGSQQRFGSQLVAMLLARPNVRAVCWNQLRDAEPHDFPHGGLFDAAGAPKPLLSSLAELRP